MRSPKEVAQKKLVTECQTLLAARLRIIMPCLTKPKVFDKSVKTFSPNPP